MPTHRGRSTVRRDRRRTTWATVTATHSVPAANGYDAVDLLSNYKAQVGASDPGVTIARIHLRVTPTAGFTAVGNSLVQGIVVTDSNDIGTNVVGAPRPASDLHVDWMYWNWDFSPAAYPGQLNQYGGASSRDIDIKSMRKMHQVSQVLAHIVQVPASAAFPAVIQVTGRILLMLP